MSGGWWGALLFLPLLVEGKGVRLSGLGVESQPPRGRGAGTPTQPLAAAGVGVPETPFLWVMMILFIIDGITV